MTDSSLITSGCVIYHWRCGLIFRHMPCQPGFWALSSPERMNCNKNICNSKFLWLQRYVLHRVPPPIASQPSPLRIPVFFQVTQKDIFLVGICRTHELNQKLIKHSKISNGIQMNSTSKFEWKMSQADYLNVSSSFFRLLLSQPFLGVLFRSDCSATPWHTVYPGTLYCFPMS